jgi:Zn-dependent protease
MFRGAFKLFRVAGITVYLHYTWFLALWFFAQSPIERYSSPVWNYAEALGLFAIVLTHEFGHALATRSVGGKADTIILWPFGGIAFVNAPRRPLATLWAIAAGPLVNVVLVPVFYGLNHLAAADHASLNLNVIHFLAALQLMNIVLLIFNILPIYPLDGGQILSSILWLFMKEAKAIRIAAAIGMIGSLGLLILLLSQGGIANNIYAILIMGFLFFTARRAYVNAGRSQNAPAVHSDCHCPQCQNSPPAGLNIKCPQCNTQFDIFAAHAVCPGCGQRYTHVPITCGMCHSTHPIADWLTVATVDAGTPGDTTPH